MMRASSNRPSKIKAAACLAVLVIAGIWAVGAYASGVRTSEAAEAGSSGFVRSQQRYSKFSHDVAAHQRLDCSKCHTFPTANWKQVRKGDDAFPDVTDYPKHASCINCHRQQFFRGTPPAICSICHTNPGPRNSARHPFPNPREIFDESAKGRTATSDFTINFPHDIHVAMMGRRFRSESGFIAAAWSGPRRSEESCAICHQTMDPQGDGDEEYFSKPPDDIGDAFWLKKGTFKSSPISHAACFTCHSQDSGMEPGPMNCATCHKPKDKFAPDFDPSLAAKMGIRNRAMLEAWRTRASSGTFRHEFFSHAEMNCADCHNTSAITNDFKTRKVAVTACSNCHITATADDGGILNFEIESRRADSGFQCSKCHVTYGKQDIPDSHLKAVAAMAGN
jgi:hypothetical protein